MVDYIQRLADAEVINVRAICVVKSRQDLPGYGIVDMPELSSPYTAPELMPPRPALWQFDNEEGYYQYFTGAGWVSVRETPGSS